MAAPSERAAASAAVNSSTLAALGTASGGIRTLTGAAPAAGPTSTVRWSPPPERAAAAAAAAAEARPDRLRSAVWANPVVSPDTTRMPAPRLRPDTSSSIRPSSSTAEDDRRSSTKISASSPPVRRAAVSVSSTSSRGSSSRSRSEVGTGFSSRGVGDGPVS